MLFWCCFGVVADEMMQNVKQGLHVLPVVAVLRSADIVNDYFEDVFYAVLFVE